MSRQRLRRMGPSCKAILLWILFFYTIAQLILVKFTHRWKTMGLVIEECKWPTLHRLLARQPDRPLVLMLGSSRTCWALHAQSLDGMPGPDGRSVGVFNFGIPSAGPIHEVLYLRDMLGEGIRPRLMLVEFLPPLLSETQRGALTEEGMTGYSSISGRDFLRLLPYLTRPRRRLHEWIAGRIALCYAFRRQIQGEFLNWASGTPNPEYPVVDAWGWRIAFDAPLSAEERARRLKKNRDGYKASLTHFHLASQPCQALHELLALCRSERIPTALVLMPESTTFRGWYSAEAKTAILDLLTQLQQSYAVSVIDASDWLADEDFEDGHHVLAHGAAVFTNRLRTEISRLLRSTAHTDSGSTNGLR